MIKGHMNQSRKNQRSTKPKSMAPTPEHGDGIAYDPADMFPLSDSNNARTHQCYADVVEPNPVTGQIHSKQTGRFVVVSNSGNNYILVVYDYDCNGILIEPMKNRTADSILKAFTAIHARLVATGLRPQLHRLDSECSEASKSFLGKETINFQLVPPSVHRRNAADRAICTFKNHFVPCTSGTSWCFPKLNPRST